MEYWWVVAVFLFLCRCLPKIGRGIREIDLSLRAIDDAREETYDPGHSVNQG